MAGDKSEENPQTEKDKGKDQASSKSGPKPKAKAKASSSKAPATVSKGPDAESDLLSQSSRVKDLAKIPRLDRPRDMPFLERALPPSGREDFLYKSPLLAGERGGYRSPLRRSHRRPLTDMHFENCYDQSYQGYDPSYDYGYGYGDQDYGDQYDRYEDDYYDDDGYSRAHHQYHDYDDPREESVQEEADLPIADIFDEEDDDESEAQEGEQDDTLLDEQEALLSEDVSKPVGTKLAKVVKSAWDSARKKDANKKLGQLYDKYPRPENIDIYKVDLNDEIKNSVPKQVKNKDMRLRAIQGAVAKATYPVIKTIQMLATMPNPTKEQKTEMVNSNSEAISMLAMASYNLNHMRRESLKGYINPLYGNICNLKIPTDSDKLFGDNIAEHMRTAGHSYRLGRGFGRGRPRYRPYAGRGRSRGFAAPFLGEDNSLNLMQEGSEEVFVGKGVNDFSCLSVGRTQTLRQSRPGPGPLDAQEVECELVPEVPSRVGMYSEEGIFDRWPKFEAGRLSVCVNKWHEITSDKIILQHVTGYRIEFVEEPTQLRPIPEIRFSQAELAILKEEVTKLQEKGVVIEVNHTEGEFISNVFLREKKESGKFRMILNLKELNKFVVYRHFKMDTLETALKLVYPGCVMASLDFTDAYYTIKVAFSDRKYLRFTLQGRVFEYTALPMGISSAPWLFTKILKVPLAYLRRNFGLTIIGYLDDTLLVDSQPDELTQKLVIAADLLQELGFMISTTKSVVQPCTQIEFLGFIIDSIAMQVTIPRGKADKIVAMVSD